LEALYAARDAAWQAAGSVRQSTIRPEDRASYEHAITALLDAVGELSHSCDLPVDARTRPGHTDSQAHDLVLVEHLGPSDVDHPN
jgi:hypothetical protein